MKIVGITNIKSIGKPVKVVDSMVERGFWKVAHGSLPD